MREPPSSLKERRSSLLLEAAEQRGRPVRGGEAAAVFFSWLAAQRDRLWESSHRAES